MKALLALAAFAVLPGFAPRPAAPADAFMARLAPLCGKAFAGRVVTNDPADAAFADKALVMHVASCEPGRVRIPFHVGEDRSRTWVVSRTATGVRLKHDHRHEDGTSDKLTLYGGDTAAPGTAARQEFPVDAESIALFRSLNAERSVTNVWAMEVDGSRFAYELRRPGRHFRVEFDLAKPVAPPPLPWGWQG
ncbi:hypothetical protein CA223_13700 [Sphingomonas koreensis]|jgi:hypothetical protein|uniref:Secreted protein n=1 Tax=Sphingomonas koreensis TaxID=93064 RepID=A0A1L6J6L9_9SPHN|nr:hypothetical protein [Sphingomonas koreensis]APR51487.1 hypothetical protein BRX40_02740 [Sphingomonas koreensis]MDC7812883.1 hypothetical protein [Sphingomonas koreensis]RSU22624.1 hypothetical protein CA224_04260 [Sphingomonas koreensis]RSU27653.1 hypothetical protein CA222_06710 [Sphingomonas koreensis]RSU29162.1 hypothetical protein CA225_06875 [Sphingomonas koreensis]